VKRRLFKTREFEKRLRIALFEALPRGWSLSSIAKVYNCQRCRAPLLVLTHSAGMSPISILIQHDAYLFALKLNVPYIMCCLSRQLIGYIFVVNKKYKRDVVDAVEFFRKLLPYEFIPQNCPRCEFRFEWQFREADINSLQFIAPATTLVDTIAFETLHRELAPTNISCIDIDAVIYDENYEIVALVEGEVGERNIRKPTTILKSLADELKVAALHVCVSHDKQKYFRVLPGGVWFDLNSENLLKVVKRTRSLANEKAKEQDELYQKTN